jgi:hypothetical protein
MIGKVAAKDFSAQVATELLNIEVSGLFCSRDDFVFTGSFGLRFSFRQKALSNETDERFRRGRQLAYGWLATCGDF